MRKLLASILFVFLVIISSITTVGFFVDTTATLPENIAGQHVNIDGLNLRVEQHGQGRDVLLIHGLPGSIEDWESVTPTLAKHYRVTIYDRPGHGYSDYSKSHANLEANTDVAAKLIDTLGLKNVIVVGHSYGGAMTLLMASRNLENVDAYVSVAGVVKEEKPAEPVYSLLSIPVFGSGLAKLANQFVGRSMMEQGVPKAFFPNIDVMPENFIEVRAKTWLNVKNSLAVTWEKLTMKQDLAKLDLTTIQQPLYILQGDSDLSVPEEHGKIIKRSIPNSELNILENTGHFIQYAQPAALIATINRAADKAAKHLTPAQAVQKP